jgi:acyl-CoA synthetase (AMP-forming)/AMP-acid ligase II
MEHRNRLEELLGASAESWPEEVALESDGESLTYAELDSAADRVAASLQDQGVRRGDRVGIHLEKSIEAVVSLYGTMRAGGAYVPLDASAPAARTAYIAADCEMAALISDSTLISALREVDPAAAPRGISLGSPPPEGFVGLEPGPGRSG